MPERKGSSSLYPLLMTVVFAAALALRLLNVWFTARFDPLASHIQLDAVTYDRWARALAFGGDAGPTTLMQAPLYPWILSLVYRLFGPSLAAVRVMQALLGTATCGLVTLCARRYFGRAAAVAAGAIAALYAPLIFYEGVLVPATLAVFLNVLFVAVLVAGADPPGRGRILAAGFVLGVACLANPMTVLLLPFALIHLGVGVGAPRPAVAGLACAKPAAARVFAGRMLAFAIGIIVALAPVTIRNALRTGEFVPLTTGGGINFYIGNNPGSNGFYSVPTYRGNSLGATPEEQWRMMQQLSSEVSRRMLSQSAASRFWLEAGLDYLRHNPRRAAGLLWDKFIFFWNDYERANVENFYFHRRFPGVLRLPLLTFGALAPLGLIGIFLTRARQRRLWLLYGGVLAYLLDALVFYVLARYRLPVVPFLAIYAGAALVELFDMAASRRTSELVLVLAATAVLAFFANRQVARDTPFGISTNFTRLGAAYVERGDTTRAVEAFEQAVTINPKNAAAGEALSKLRRGGVGIVPPAP
jgi:hypothetical protein